MKFTEKIEKRKNDLLLQIIIKHHDKNTYNSTFHKKWCSIHKNNWHNTADCYNNPDGKNFKGNKKTITKKENNLLLKEPKIDLKSVEYNGKI